MQKDRLKRTTKSFKKGDIFLILEINSGKSDIFVMKEKKLTKILQK